MNTSNLALCSRKKLENFELINFPSLVLINHHHELGLSTLDRFASFKPSMILVYSHVGNASFVRERVETRSRSRSRSRTLETNNSHHLLVGKNSHRDSIPLEPFHLSFLVHTSDAFFGCCICNVTADIAESFTISTSLPLARSGLSPSNNAGATL